MPSTTTVLVTGGSGFIGSHTILQLLAAGHQVRTTVRNLKREADVRAMLQQGGLAQTDGRLTFTLADLEKDAGWPEAVDRCDYVLHVASPLPPGVPKHEDELIIPAREGALRVLRAARDAGVSRVVLTSSFAAIGYGHPPQSGAIHGEGLERPQQRRGRLPEIEDPGRTCCLGFHRPRRRHRLSSPSSTRWPCLARSSGATIQPPSFSSSD